MCMQIVILNWNYFDLNKLSLYTNNNKYKLIIIIFLFNKISKKIIFQIIYTLKKLIILYYI